MGTGCCLCRGGVDAQVLELCVRALCWRVVASVCSRSESRDASPQVQVTKMLLIVLDFRPVGCWNSSTFADADGAIAGCAIVSI